MEKELCDRLIDALLMRGGAILPQKTPVTYELMEELFSAEEAALACTMPFEPATADTIAQGAGGDVFQTTATLESMADKGLVFVHEKGGIIFYRLMSLAPGIYEYQFMAGEVNERARRLARLFDECTPVAGKEKVAFSAPSFNR